MDAALLVDLYRQMCLCRRIEEAAAQAYSQGKIGGFLHLYIGQEAVARRARSRRREPTDYVVATYREHAHSWREGRRARRDGRALRQGDRLRRGRGGSMHLFDAEHALPRRLRHRRRPRADRGRRRVRVASTAASGDVTLCFFGDGAANMGAFHEGLALAALWKLPVVFICENNQYSMGTPLYRTLAVEDVVVRARGYGMSARSLRRRRRPRGARGASPRRSSARARDEPPSSSRSKTYRFRGHSMSDPAKYRTKDEVEKWKKRDPDPGPGRSACETLGIADARSALKQLEDEVKAEVEDAVEFAEESPAPAPETVARTTSMTDAQPRILTFREALREAMVEEMERDDAHLPHGRGGRPLQRRLQGVAGHARALRRAARDRHADRRDRLRRASASARRWSGCGRSSSS